MDSIWETALWLGGLAALGWGLRQSATFFLRERRITRRRAASLLPWRRP